MTMRKTFPINVGSIHIIGIGGIGMSGYAEILHNMGYAVQGSDMSENANVTRLRDLGVTVHVGHRAENVLDKDGQPASVVVKSTAVKDDNPEIIAAQEKDITIIPRVDLLAEMMRGKWGIAVSGTHGKTTTTSMVGHVLEKAGLDPTVINGGIINAYGSNARLGDSRWMVVESDESDGTFSHLPAVASVITNIDPEHLDHYGDFETLKDEFVAFANNLPFYGLLVACIDHPVVEELLPQFHRRTLTYGFSDKADVQAVNVQTTPSGLVFDVLFDADKLPKFAREIKGVKLPMFGRHNVLNALSTFCLAHDLGVAADTVASALAKFQGVKRRFTTTGIVDNITVIDDYGHHPVEIAAVLKAGKDAISSVAGARIIAIMQPHRYSRLSSLFEDFSKCFVDADEVIIAPVYAAGEKPKQGFDHHALVAAIAKTGKTAVRALEKPEDLAGIVNGLAKPGDFVICLGAGTITQWAGALPAQLATLRGIDNGGKQNGASCQSSAT